jgi:recombinational DNA repair ATPase RecF
MAYRELAGDTMVGATYDATWLTAPDEAEAALLLALGAGRRAELDRGVTLAGPHRD